MTKFSRGVGGLGDLDIIQTLAFVWNIYIIIVLIAGTDPPPSLSTESKSQYALSLYNYPITKVFAPPPF